MGKIVFVVGVCLVVSAGLVLSGCGKGESQAKGGPQTMCPVMGTKIDKNLYVDYEGKRIFFCCEGCPATFRAGPEKYMKKMADEGVVLEDAPK